MLSSPITLSSLDKSARSPWPFDSFLVSVLVSILPLMTSFGTHFKRGDGRGVEEPPEGAREKTGTLEMITCIRLPAH